MSKTYLFLKVHTSVHQEPSSLWFTTTLDLLCRVSSIHWAACFSVHEPRFPLRIELIWTPSVWLFNRIHVGSSPSRPRVPISSLSTVYKRSELTYSLFILSCTRRRTSKWEKELFYWDQIQSFMHFSTCSKWEPGRWRSLPDMTAKEKKKKVHACVYSAVNLPFLGLSTVTWFKQF